MAERPIYLHHEVTAEPRAWRGLARQLADAGRERIEAEGGSLFGIWRSQIGRPRDELAVITCWPDAATGHRVVSALLGDLVDMRSHTANVMLVTVRPVDDTPPARQGNYAFRWFETPVEHWDEFLDLCVTAWPGFEAAYDSQVIGLWRMAETVRSAACC